MTCAPVKFSTHAIPILVFGRDGQVGKALQQCLSKLQMPAVFLGHAECDLAHEASIIKVLDCYQPQVIINAAAYTAVDQAESEADLVFAINAHAPDVMANYIANIPGGTLVHYSSDYVFSDTKTTSYFESDTAGPINHLNVYGKSKLMGEQLIEETFRLRHRESGLIDSEKDLSRYFILRTSWIYGDGDNFIKKILHLAGKKNQLEVISDQIGVPTSAKWLAEISMKIIDSSIKLGIYHVVPDGEASWYDLTIWAIDVLTNIGEGVNVNSKKIIPVAAIDYSSLAKRPYNSRLNNAKLKEALLSRALISKYPHWTDHLKAYVETNIIATSNVSEVDNGPSCQ